MNAIKNIFDVAHIHYIIGFKFQTIVQISAVRCGTLLNAITIIKLNLVNKSILFLNFVLKNL